MKKIIKQWWFWCIICLILIVISIIIIKVNEEKQLEESINNVANGMNTFIENIDNAESYADDFYYNENTGEVEYIPNSLTMDKYNKISYGMTEKQVIEILGTGEKLMPQDGNTYLITYGNLNLSKIPYYYVTITFDKHNNTVASYNQLGLK